MIKAVPVILALLMTVSCGAKGSPETSAEKETSETVTSSVTEQIVTLPPLSGSETAEPETTDSETTEPGTTEPETTEPAASYELGFKEDLSEYEKYLDPEDRDGYLLLVNPEHPLGRDYKPSDLTLLTDRREGRKDELRLYAGKALEAFLMESRANGCKTMTSVSAYRPYNTQEYIFDNEVKGYMEEGMTREEAIKKARSDTAYPGESEHQSGLAVDVLDYGSTLSTFGGTFEAEWLAANCWKFGFILRYPEDKESITTYVYEPWHFRYVGRYHAKRIFDMHMCLEEYIEYLANN